jgi:hypothetical protein
MAWRTSDETDTLPYADQVRAWMERFWRDTNTCQVCGQNEWRAEGRMFLVTRTMPGQEPGGQPELLFGVGRSVFPVVCMHCGHTLWVGSQVAGIAESPIPMDLSGLDDTKDG